MFNNDNFVRVGIDRILLHHKYSKNFKMISLLIKNFERAYFNVIKELTSQEAYELREEIYASFQVVHYDSVFTSHMILLRHQRKNIDEI